MTDRLARGRLLQMPLTARHHWTILGLANVQEARLKKPQAAE